MKMSRCTVLSLLFSIMCVLTSGIVVNQPGSSLDAVQDQLQQALVRELAKGTKGKNDEQSNTTVTMDATHNMKVTAVANITTQSETHVVVTHGTPADAPVIHLIKRMLSLKEELSLEAERLGDRQEYVDRECGTMIDRAGRYIRQIRPKNKELPKDIDSNPFKCPGCINKAEAEAVVVVRGGDQNVQKIIHKKTEESSTKSDTVTAFIEKDASHPSGTEEMSARVRDLLREAEDSAKRVVDEGDASFKSLAKDLGDVYRAADQGAFNIDDVVTNTNEQLSEAQRVINNLVAENPSGLAAFPDADIDDRVESSFRKAFENAVAFRATIIKQCHASLELVKKETSEVERELKQVNELGLQLFDALEPLDALTWHDAELAENEKEETRAASEVDTIMGAIVKAAEMRSEAQETVEEASRAAEKLHTRAEKTEEADLEARGRVVELKQKEFLMTRSAEAAEKFAHDRMSLARIALHCSSESKTSNADEVEDGAVRAETLSQMTATVKASLAEARREIGDVSVEEGRSNEDRKHAFERAEEVESSAESLLRTIDDDGDHAAAFLELGSDDENPTCSRHWTRSAAEQIKDAADAAAKEANKYVNAALYISQKVRDNQKKAASVHEINLRASNEWERQLRVVSLSKKSVEQTQVLIDGLKSKLDTVKPNVAASSERVDAGTREDDASREALTNFRQTRLIARQLLKELCEWPFDEGNVGEPAASALLQISSRRGDVGTKDADSTLLDDIESRMSGRAAAQRKRWEEAFKARSDLMDAATNVREAEGKMKIARLKMMQRQLEYESARADASDDADGKEIPVTGEMAASAAASAAAFLRAREARESLDALSKAASEAKRRSRLALVGHVGDARVPDKVEKRWRTSEDSVQSVVQGMIEDGIESYSAKGSFEASLARLHSTTSQALRSAVKGQLSMENVIDRLQNGYEAVVAKDSEIDRRQTESENAVMREKEALERDVQRMKADVKSYLAAEDDEVQRWKSEEENEVSKFKARVTRSVQHFKKAVEEQLLRIASNVTTLRALTDKATQVRKRHNASIHDHAMKLANARAQIARLRAIVAGVDTSELGLDASRPDLVQLAKSAKMHREFFEDEVLAGYRANIDSAHDEMTNIAGAMRATGGAQDDDDENDLLSLLQIGDDDDDDDDHMFDDTDDIGITGATGATGANEVEVDDDVDADSILGVARRMVKEGADWQEPMDLASATADYSKKRDVSSKFHEYAVRAQHEARAERKRAEALDRAFVDAQRKRDDTLMYARSMNENLKELTELVDHIRAALSLGTLDPDMVPRLKKELDSATRRKDEAFESAQNAVVDVEAADELVKDTHDQRYFTWRSAHTAATDAKEAAQISAQLQVLAARSLVAYTNALVSKAEKETQSLQQHVRELGREAFSALGQLASSAYVAEFRGPSNLDDLSVEDLPVPMGSWMPSPSLKIDVNVNDASLDVSPDAPIVKEGHDAEVETIVQDVVALLKAATTRQTALKQKMWSVSSEIESLDDKKASASNDVERGHLASEQQLLQKSLSDIDTKFESMTKVIAKLRVLLRERLQLRARMRQVKDRRENAQRAAKLFQSVEAKAAEGMLSATNAAISELSAHEKAAAANDQAAYQNSMLEKYGTASVATTFLQLREALDRLAIASDESDESSSQPTTSVDLDGATGGESAEFDVEGVPNIGAILDGKYGDIDFPEWDDLSPQAAKEVASAALDHASYFGEETAKTAMAAAAVARESKELFNDSDDLFDDAASDFDKKSEAAHKAQLLSDAYGSLYGDPTAMAWEEMSLTGPEGSFESMDGPKRESVRDRIEHYRDVIRNGDAQLDDAQRAAQDASVRRREAEETRDEKEADALDAKIAQWKAEGEQERMQRWEDDQKRIHADAIAWEKENEEAEKEAERAAKESEDAKASDGKNFRRLRRR